MNSRDLDSRHDVSYSIDYHFIFNNADEAIILWECDPHYDRCTVAEVNDYACKKYGYSREEFIGLPESKITACDVRTNFRKIQNNLKLFGHTTAEVTIVTKDGTLIPSEVKAHRFDYLEKTFVLSIYHDIAERLKIENHNIELMTKTLLSEQVSNLLSKIDSAKYSDNKFGGFSFSPSLKEINYNGKKTSLTPIESTILRHLLLGKGKTVSYSNLEKIVGNEHSPRSLKNIRVYTHNLRDKLKIVCPDTNIIVTKPGRGYQLISGFISLIINLLDFDVDLIFACELI